MDVLSSAGFSVTEAVNGRQALDTLERQPAPDAILLDLMMPVMDGWEFRALQKRDPVLRKTPVVVLTAANTPQADAIDAAHVLHKPLSLESLVGTLQRIVDAGRRRASPPEGAERLEGLALLADGVANRVNTPISSILGSLRALQELHACMTADPRTRERARQLVLDGLEQTDAIRRVVHDLWAFARDEDRTRTPVDPRSVLESSITIVVCRARAQVKIGSEHESVPPVLAHQGRLLTLFSQLLTNAVEAARSSVRTRLFAERNEVIVEISDDGIGMTPETLRRVFDPFFSTKPASEGSGLGSSIAHGIATSLGGRIEIESALGRGSTFRVRLPAASSGLFERR